MIFFECAYCGLKEGRLDLKTKKDEVVMIGCETCCSNIPFAFLKNAIYSITDPSAQPSQSDAQSSHLEISKPL